MLCSVYLIILSNRKVDNMAWLIADTHFNHTNIIRYCNRPFANAKEMNEYIIQQWNNTVTKEDTVYHLGDFGFGGRKTITNLVNQLNGNIILILGNHDRHGKQWFLDCGFTEVYRRLKIGSYVLTHRPQTLDKLNGCINIHGHTHGRNESLDKDKYIDVSVETINYKPIWIDIKG